MSHVRDAGCGSCMGTRVLAHAAHGCVQVILLLLRCELMDAFIIVHGNDIIILGDGDAHIKADHVMSSQYTIKCSFILGTGLGDVEELRTLHQ